MEIVIDLSVGFSNCWHYDLDDGDDGGDNVGNCDFRINPESWIQFEEELGIERQLQIHSRFVKKKEGASIKK